MKTLLNLFLLTGIITGSQSLAQDVKQSPSDSLNARIDKLESDVKVLNKVKISGYIQAQYQIADSTGIESFAGGNFSVKDANGYSNVYDKRMMVRRGRIKFTYNGNLSEYVLQLDATEKGVALKDVYAKFTEPYLKTFSLSTGVMNRPFGFEVPYSSSLRESPERGRMSQTIFPDERELGAMITMEAPKTSALSFLKIEAGYFNGAGPKAVEFDYQKDFIGHITLKKSLLDEKIKLSGGFSLYEGGYISKSTNISQFSSTGFVKDSSKSHLGELLRREYLGADAQVSVDFPFGLTTLRAEYIQGTQPGTSSSTKSFDIYPTSKPAASVIPADIYLRKFNGAYFYFLQNIGQSRHQLLVKYDWYDPNTQIASTDIGSKAFSKTGAADIKYTTLGLGWIYRYDANIKITAYYDMVKNESTSVSRISQDLQDNVFTLRLQYKF